MQDFPRDPVVKNPSCNTGDNGSMPGGGTKIPHTLEQLSLRTTTRQSMHHHERSHMMQERSCVLQDLMLSNEQFFVCFFFLKRSYMLQEGYFIGVGKQGQRITDLDPEEALQEYLKNEEEQSIHWNSMCKGFEAILGNERQQTGPASWRRTRK